MERLIKRGAEAQIFLGEWYGKPAIIKRRMPKPYRHPKIDEELRKRRTLHEATFLVRARRAGVATPIIYFLDPQEGEIVMQYIEGRRLTDLLNEAYDERDAMTILGKIFEALGERVAHLHRARMVHGDLTTSNIIVVDGGRLFFLDFGLSFHSERIEDYAVDIHLLKEVLTSAHGDRSEGALQRFLHGYEGAYGEGAKAILDKVREIERRGRYARVE